MTQNGVATQHLLPAALSQYGRHYGTAQAVPSYSLQATSWVPQFVMPHPHMAQVDVRNISNVKY